MAGKNAGGRNQKMKTFTVCVTLCLAACLTLSPLMAQGRGGMTADKGPAVARDSGGSGGVSTPAAVGNSGAGAVGVAGSSGGYATGGGGGGIAYQPNLSGTSFQNYNTYYNWNNYYSYLWTHYNLSPLYFGRFYRNFEPLITPDILKVTLREPIRLSSDMLGSIDELEGMLAQNASASPADKRALLEKSKHIREIAKQIRRNQTLSNYDIRKYENLFKNEEDLRALGPEALNKLREMAVDLDRQLRNMYSQSSTSTVSVDSYSEPSIESLAKGIEKLCKAIEQSSKRI
jgi:hypothetical protein